MTDQDGSAADEAEVQNFVTGLIERAAEARLPELFNADHPNAIYHVPNRNGISVIALRTPDLTEAQLITLMKYRLAQYLAVNFVDSVMIYQQRMEYEPLTGVSPEDIHLIAGSVETGEILCYAAIKAAPNAPPNKTLREKDRPFFPVEKVHGWGIFNRLRVMPDLPVVKLREAGRFVKNQRLHMLDELGARGPIEVGVAMFRSLSGPLRLEIEAVLGDLEEGVAKQNLEFFHVPMVVLHGTVPYEAEASYFFPRYQYCTVYPFAILSADISRSMMARLEAIEEALEQPGKKGLMRLFALKRDIHIPRSSLEPPEGLAPLSNADMPQREVAMQTRRQMLDAGERLRDIDLFKDLSVAEATVLGSFMERRDAADGETIVRQGDVGEDLFLIESGQAEVRLKRWGGDPVTVATLGPGDYFGEIALVTGAERIADVVAITPMTLLSLSKDSYARYLAHADEVEQEITRTAASRTTDSMRKMMSGNP